MGREKGVSHPDFRDSGSETFSFKEINYLSSLLPRRLKQRQQVADISTVCDSVESDWSGAHSRTAQQDQQQQDQQSLRDQVHQALGQLIKQRRVYYTGESTVGREGIGCWDLGGRRSDDVWPPSGNKGYFLVSPSEGAAGAGVGNPVLRGLGGLGHRFTRIRHSLRDRSGSPNGRSTGGRMVDQVGKAALDNEF